MSTSTVVTHTACDGTHNSGAQHSITFTVSYGRVPLNEEADLCACAGDVHIFLDEKGDSGVLSIYHEDEGWLTWHPSSLLTIDTGDGTMYATSDENIGMTFRCMQEEASQRSGINKHTREELVKKLLASVVPERVEHTVQSQAEKRVRDPRLSTELSERPKIKKVRRSSPSPRHEVLEGGGAQASNEKEEGSEGRKGRGKKRGKAKANRLPQDTNIGKAPAVKSKRRLLVESDVVMEDAEITLQKGKQKAMKKEALTKTKDTDVEMLNAEEKQTSPFTLEEELEPDYRRLLKGVLKPPRNARAIDCEAHSVSMYRAWTCQKDSEASAFLARAPKAVDVQSTYPMVVEIEHSGSVTEIRSRILEHLSRGTAVLVYGWSPEFIVEFSEEAISEYRPHKFQPITWQGKHSKHAKLRAEIFTEPIKDRTYASQLVDGSLEEFVRAGLTFQECFNCLDLPVPNPEIPMFLKGVLHDSVALAVSAKECYIEKDGQNSSYNSSLLGPQVMRYDAWRTVGWDVFTHAGFMTYPHHDGGGYHTWSHVRSGAKVWAYVHLDDVDESNWEEVQQRWREYYTHTMATETYNHGVKIGTILLEKDAVLIQPPGLNHMVYTPVPTIMSGGHFLTYDAMHLTEMALSLDYGLDNGNATFESFNAVHPGALRKIYRMIIALPYIVQDRPLFPRRSVLAMVVLAHMDFEEVDDMDDFLKLEEEDSVAQETKGEGQRARHIMRLVMDVLEFADECDVKSELHEGLWRDPGNMVDLSFLKSMTIF